MSSFYKNFQKITQISCATTSLLLNTLLIFLIIIKSPKSIGFYKYLMIYISLFEAVYSILDVSSEPVIYSYGSAFIAFSNINDSFLNKHLSFVVIIIYAGCFGFSLALFAVHFLYRYSIIQSSFKTQLLQGSRKLILFIIPLFYGFWWTYLCSLFSRNAEVDAYMQDTMLSSYNVSMEDVTYICFMFFTLDERGMKTPNNEAFLAILCMMFMILSSMFCVFYFGTKCYKIINHAFDGSSNRSAFTQSLQKQLFYALVVQTCIPLILMYIPAGFLFLTAIFEIQIGFASSIVAITIAIYPAVDPLPNLLIIKDYRKAIKVFVVKNLLKVLPKRENNTNNQTSRI
ncbi:unnamed protein product [Caenorhabditis angaria]|uniref:Serpentine receptor class r-10 n=1 Tax=Caenorhabditis angaria TaxID=860376 RepID=A0A9P1IV74_9PELO|nr:unnamed protein product [Caenorhabditis angaria]